MVKRPANPMKGRAGLTTADAGTSGKGIESQRKPLQAGAKAGVTQSGEKRVVGGMHQQRKTVNNPKQNPESIQTIAPKP